MTYNERFIVQFGTYTSDNLDMVLDLFGEQIELMNNTMQASEEGER